CRHSARSRDSTRQGYVAAQHVQELRQIDNPGVLQEFPDSCLARAATPGCGPKAKKRELAAVSAQAVPAIERRPRALQLNSQSDEHHEGECENEQRSCDQNISDAQ